MERLHRSRINTNNKPNQHQVLRREGLAVAVPTWTSRTSKRRSSVSSFSLSEANLLLVVASERNFIQNVITISRKSSPRKNKIPKTKISEETNKKKLPNWRRNSKRRRTLREMWEMNSRFSQSACTAIPTLTAFVIPPALAILPPDSIYRVQKQKLLLFAISWPLSFPVKCFYFILIFEAKLSSFSPNLAFGKELRISVSTS